VKAGPNADLSAEQMVPDFFRKDGGGGFLQRRIAVFEELGETQEMIGKGCLFRNGWRRWLLLSRLKRQKGVAVMTLITTVRAVVKGKWNYRTLRISLPEMMTCGRIGRIARRIDGAANRWRRIVLRIVVGGSNNRFMVAEPFEAGQVRPKHVRNGLGDPMIRR